MNQSAGRPAKSPEDASAEVDSGFAPNLGVLAQLLGIDRRTLTAARKRFESDCPEARDDGRYPIAEYAKWLDRHGVEGRSESPELSDERELKLALARLDLERKRFEFERIKDRMLPAAQFEAALFRTHSALLAAINSFGPRINEKLEGLGFDDRAAVLETESELLRKTIARCDFLEVEEAEDE